MPSSPQMAQPRRFMSTRTSLGNFGKSGSKQALKKGLGHYAKTGLGGAAAATQRMARTAHTAGNLYSVLDALRTGTEPPVESGITAQSLAGKSEREIADNISHALTPADGTCRRAVRKSFVRPSRPKDGSLPTVTAFAAKPMKLPSCGKRTAPSFSIATSSEPLKQSEATSLPS